MKRLCRRIFYGFSCVSLVLCAAAASMWVRSHFAHDDFVLANHWILTTAPGKIAVIDWTMPVLYIPDAADPLRIGTVSRQLREFVGFEYLQFTAYDGTTKLFVGVPFWFLLVVFSLLPLAFGVSARQWRSKKAGFCTKCGYDLRATPERCPECGTVVLKADRI